MSRLLERIFMTLVMLSVALWVFSSVSRALTGLAAQVRLAASPILGDVMTTALVGCFGVGLVVRCVSWLRESQRGRNQRGSGDRRPNQAVRRPTEEPQDVHQPASPDDDPALPFNLEG